jgi:uncharacterized protein (TIRG00374 family)
LGAASVGLVGGGPVGNSTAIVHWLRKGRVSTEASLVAGWLLFVLNPGLEIVVGFVGLLYLLLLHRLPALMVGGASIGLVVLGAIIMIVLLSLRRPEVMRGRIHWLARAYARLRRRHYEPATVDRGFSRLSEAWRLLRNGGWTGPALGSALNVGSDMLALYLLFLAAGHTVTPGVLLAGYGIPLMLGKLTILPGGLGIVEGSMAAMYEGLGVPSAVTVVVIIIYRLISFWTPILLGIPTAVYLQHADRAKVRRT